MDESIDMTVIHGFCYLLDKTFGLLFSQYPLFFDKLEQLSSFKILHDNAYFHIFKS